MSLARSTAVIGFFTLLSRISGFARDVLVANMIGASWLSDAFFVAFKLPNFFRRLFAEGAFNAAFVPLFAGSLAKEGKERALTFASEAFAVLLVALLILNAVFLVFMPVLLYLFAPGFAAEPEKFDLTVTLSRIAFPYILFISLVSLLGGILNSIERFAAVASTPILLNLCLIFSLLFLSPITETPAHALSIGVFLAGIAQLGWLIWSAKRYDVLPRWAKPRLTHQVKTLLKLIAPAALGAGVAQINLLIDVILASTMPDAVSYLYYADRLNELPLGVIGVAVGTALLPMLSKQIRSGQAGAARHTMNRAIELSLFLALPAAVGLILLAGPLITLLFEHGAFTRHDSYASFLPLIAYAAGLPAFILIKIFAPGFYANRDTKTPFIIASLCVLLNLVLNLILMQSMAHIGLALATSIAGWVNATAMGVVLWRRGHFAPDRELILRLFRIIFVCACLAGALFFVRPLFDGYHLRGLAAQIGIMVAVLLPLKVGYFGLAYGLHAVDRSSVRRVLGKKSSM